MPWYDKRTSREKNGTQIPGIFLSAIIHNLHHYLTQIAVYQDEMIDCWGLMTLEEFHSKIESGWVTNVVPAGKTLQIHNLLKIKVEASVPVGEMEDLFKDAKNAIEELNGRPTAQNLLIDAIKEFNTQDTLEARKAMCEAYLKLPSYYRIFIFDRHPRAMEVVQAECARLSEEI